MAVVVPGGDAVLSSTVPGGGALHDASKGLPSHERVFEESRVLQLLRLRAGLDIYLVWLARSRLEPE